MIGLSEVEEGLSYGQEVLDEVTVEVNKAYKGLLSQMVTYYL